MQVSYNVNLAKAIKGQPHGAPRMTVPMTLPYLPQIQTITISDGTPAAGEAWTITAVDDASEQSYSFSFDSGASLAVTLDNLVAGLATSGKMNDLFTATEDGATVATLTARHENRSYTLTVTPGGSAAAVVAETQAAGGAGLELGLMVAQATTGDAHMRAVAQGDAVSDLRGILFRTDGNHFHSLETGELPTSVDLSERGRTYSILERGRVWVEVEEAVTPASTPFVRLAGTGDIGGFRASEDGGQQVATVTPTAAELDFLIQIHDLRTGERVSLLSANPDGTATATEICDAWRTAAATAQADGALTGYTFGGTATLTITGPAGRAFEVLDVGEGVSAVADTTPADVDALDVSSVCRFETSAGAGELALLRIDL